MYRYKFWDWILNMINEQCYGKLSFNIENKKEYLAFKNREETQEWGSRYYKEWARQYEGVMERFREVLSKDNSPWASTIECYCGFSYREINEFLRDQKNDQPHIAREMAHILTMILCSAPKIPCDLVVYRMVNDEFIKELIEKNRQKLPTPIQEKGFMSTSLLKSIANEKEAYANKNSMLKIFVPQYTIGVYVNVVTKRNEEEMLLVPNMFLGLASYPYKDEQVGKIIYECKLIPSYKLEPMWI